MSKYAQGTHARMIEVALAEVGYAEGPKDNETKYGAFTKRNFLPWCGSFLMWVAKESGVHVPDCVSTKDGADSFKSSNHFHTEPKIGDFVFFDFIDDNKTVINHIGLVIRVSDKAIVTVEGNTSGGAKDRTGGQVMLKTRALGKSSFIVGYGRPVYKSPTLNEEKNEPTN
jgi:hypothetical protein